jgi:nitrite reductase (cytochrome c-552)
MKISDHHVRSPLLNTSNACLTCHRWSEEEMKARVETIQERTWEMRNRSMDALMELINDIKAAKQAGVSEAQITEAQVAQRKAGFLLDFVEAENSTGFHAPQEAARILDQSLEYTRRGQLALRVKFPQVVEIGKDTLPPAKAAAPATGAPAPAPVAAPAAAPPAKSGR